MKPETIEELVGLQARILEAAEELVPPSGVLVYSTCSLELEENQAQVEGFLERNTQFFLEESGTVPSEYVDEEGYLSITPQATGFDGAFAARLVRKS
jgi:16S rRNA (cytosine967-C5)-methyltransferase